MKARFASLIALVSLVAGQANAIVRPGWERPILRAELQQLAAGGAVTNYHLKKSLTMNKQDGFRQPTSFTLVEENQVFCVRAPCPPIKRVRQFRVQSVAKVGCGSVRYTSVEVAPHGLTDFPAAVLNLTDHTTRLCDDYRPYLWEVTVRSPREALRRFGGKPEPVYTIQTN